MVGQEESHLDKVRPHLLILTTSRESWGCVMKNVAIVLSLAFLAVAVATTAAEDTTTLTVAGEGTVTVPADTVYITVSVTTSGDNSTKALEENVENLNRTIDALLNAGLDEENVLPGYGRSSQTIKTYNRVCNNTTCAIVENVISKVTYQVTIKLDSDEDSEKFLEAAKAEGARAEITGYELSDTGPAMTKARKNAVENANENAEELASAAGLKVSKTLEIFEPSPPRIYHQSFDQTGPSGLMDLFGWSSYQRYPAEPGESGMVQVSSYVVVTYELSS